MKIGVISVNDKSTTLLARGGTEVFSANLSFQLANLGHEVYLFGSGDSSIEGVKLFPPLMKICGTYRKTLVLILGMS